MQPGDVSSWLCHVEPPAGARVLGCRLCNSPPGLWGGPRAPAPPPPAQLTPGPPALCSHSPQPPTLSSVPRSAGLRRLEPGGVCRLRFHGALLPAGGLRHEEHSTGQLHPQGTRGSGPRPPLPPRGRGRADHLPVRVPWGVAKNTGSHPRRAARDAGKTWALGSGNPPWRPDSATGLSFALHNRGSGSGPRQSLAVRPAPLISWCLTTAWQGVVSLPDPSFAQEGLHLRVVIHPKAQRSWHLTLQPSS